MDILDCYEFKFADAVSRCGGILNFLHACDGDGGDNKDLHYQVEMTTREYYRKRNSNLLDVVDKHMMSQHLDTLYKNQEHDVKTPLEELAKRGNIYSHIMLGIYDYVKMDDEWVDKILNSDIPGAVMYYADNLRDGDIDSRILERLQEMKETIELLKIFARIYDTKKDGYEKAICYYEKLYDLEKTDGYLWDVVRLYYHGLHDKEKALLHRPAKCILRFRNEVNITLHNQIKEKYPDIISETERSPHCNERYVLKIVDPRNNQVKGNYNPIHDSNILDWLHTMEHYFI